MGSKQILGVLLVALGLLGVVLGGFSYTKQKQRLELGPMAMEVEEKERVPIPLWLGVGLIAAGGVILIVGRGKRG